MQKNIKNRTQEKVFKCEQCGKYFFHKIHLSLHQRGHLNQLSVILSKAVKNTLRSSIVQSNILIKSANEAQCIKNQPEYGEKQIQLPKSQTTALINKCNTETTSKSYKNFDFLNKIDDVNEKYNIDSNINMNLNHKDKFYKSSDSISEFCFLCKVCGLNFHNMVSLKEHENNHEHETSLEPVNKIKSICNIKSKSFTNRNIYTKNRSRQIRKIINNRSRILDLKNLKEKIGNNFMSKKKLRKIYKIKKQFKNRKSQNEIIQTEKRLEFPKENHNIKNKLNCNQCEKSFFHLQHLRLHEKNHMNMNLKSVLDDNKEKSIEKSTILNQFELNSVNTDSNNKLHKCGSCEKSFFHLNHLRIHERIHKNEIPIVGPEKDEIRFNIIEEKNSSNELSLSILVSPILDINTFMDVEKIEELTDSNEKCYECKRCNKTFFHESHLKMHQRSHTKIESHKILKPHKCTMCMSSFLELTNLEKHILQMHEKKTYVFSESLTNRYKQLYKCDECEKEFKAKSHLASHKRAHFKDTSKEINLQNETDSSNNVYIVEEIYGDYDFNNEQSDIYSDHMYSENEQQVQSVINVPCSIVLNEENNASSYDNNIINTFLYKCKLCDLLFQHEEGIKEHILITHEKNDLNVFKSTELPLKIANQLVSNCNNSQSYIQKLDLDNLNEHNYHLIQISDLYFENNYNNIESELP